MTDRSELLGYADSLDQQANWVEESLAPETPDSQRIGIEDIDIDELRGASDLFRRLASSDGGVMGEAEPVAWHNGAPPKPWADEWFIAETIYHERVVLRSLPEEYTYDFKTADETYIKAANIKRWMQFPDSEYIAKPADAGMREALERCLYTSIHPHNSGWRVAIGFQNLEDAQKAHAALTAPGATTKSDVEALAATTAERPGTVTSEPEPSTSESARDDGPLGYERVTDGTTLPGDKFRYALDNNGVTGKVIGHFRPIKPGPSDPSSTHTIAHDGDAGIPNGLQAAIDDTRANMDRALSRLPKLKATSDPSSTRSDVTALADIAKERQRQREVEGWTPEHDDAHVSAELAMAGASYALASFLNTEHALNTTFTRYWPWDRKWWKPKTPRENLVRAGALIVAEIERLDRLDQFEIRRK